MLRRTLLVLPCRTWCVRRCRLSAGFISPHLVYAELGTRMPQLLIARLLSSPHLIRAHAQPQRDMWAFDTYGEARMTKLSSRPASLCYPSESANLEARRHKLKRCKLCPKKDSEKKSNITTEVLWVMFPTEESSSVLHPT